MRGNQNINHVATESSARTSGGTLLQFAVPSGGLNFPKNLGLFSKKLRLLRECFFSLYIVYLKILDNIYDFGRMCVDFSHGWNRVKKLTLKYFLVEK